MKDSLEKWALTNLEPVEVSQDWIPHSGSMGKESKRNDGWKFQSDWIMKWKVSEESQMKVKIKFSTIEISCSSENKF